MKEQEGGFTLVELLVVIAVIGMLTSIVLVVFSPVREKARLAKAEDFSSHLYRVLGADAVAILDFVGNANDVSGYGNDGVVTGAVLAQDRHGEANQAYSFDGSNDYINIDSPSGMAWGTGDFTVTGWIYVESFAGSPQNPQVMRVQTPEHSLAWGAYVNRDTERITFNARRPDGTHAAISSPSIREKTWVFFAGKRQGGGVFVSADGGSWAAGPADATMSFSDPINIRIGARPDTATDPFYGRIDDIRIYDRPLTAQEIRNYYASALPRYQVAFTE